MSPAPTNNGYTVVAGYRRSASSQTQKLAAVQDRAGYDGR